jgi:hypothetical protein
MSCFARRFRCAKRDLVRHVDREEHVTRELQIAYEIATHGPLPQVTINLHSSHRNLGAGTAARMSQGAARELCENISRPAAVVHFASASYRLWRRQQISTVYSSQSLH